MKKNTLKLYEIIESLQVKTISIISQGPVGNMWCLSVGWLNFLMADALTGIVGKEDLGIPGSLLDDAHGDRWEHLLSFNPMARVVGGLDGILVSKVKYMFFTVYLCTPKDVD